MTTEIPQHAIALADELRVSLHHVFRRLRQESDNDPSGLTLQQKMLLSTISLQPGIGVAELARRADLDRHALNVLAGGDALRGLSGHRRQALWQAVGAVPDKDLLRPTMPEEDTPQLQAPSEGEDILGDYRSHGLTLRRHPVALLRPTLRKHRFMPAEVLNSYTNNMVALKAVENGEVAAVLVNNYYWFALQREKGQLDSKLYYFTDGDAGGLVTVSSAGVLKASKHPKEAQQLLAYMASEEGQRVITNTTAEYPMRKGMVSERGLKPFEELQPPKVTPADLGNAEEALDLERDVGLL